MKDLNISVVVEAELAREAAVFFAANVDANYISHGDIIDGRAKDTSNWSEDVVSVFAAETLQACKAADPLLDGLHLVIASTSANRLAGIMLYEFATGKRNRIIQLHDLIVERNLHGRGIGSAMLKWLEAQAGKADQLFLESGLGNHSAHDFFAHHGYKQCSIVMIKSFN